jgi:hypothetical protein
MILLVIEMIDLSKETIEKLFFERMKELSIKATKNSNRIVPYY